MSRHVRESRHVSASVTENTLGRVVFRLEPGPSEQWQELFRRELEDAAIDDAAEVRFDQYLVYAEKARRDSRSTERAKFDHIVRDIVRLVDATNVEYRTRQDDTASESASAAA